MHTITVVCKVYIIAHYVLIKQYKAMYQHQKAN
jgi:hypothetical protein